MPFDQYINLSFLIYFLYLIVYKGWIRYKKTSTTKFWGNLIIIMFIFSPINLGLFALNISSSIPIYYYSHSPYMESPLGSGNDFEIFFMIPLIWILLLTVSILSFFIILFIDLHKQKSFKSIEEKVEYNYQKNDLKSNKFHNFIQLFLTTLLLLVFLFLTFPIKNAKFISKFNKFNETYKLQKDKALEESIKLIKEKYNITDLELFDPNNEFYNIDEFKKYKISHNFNFLIKSNSSKLMYNNEQISFNVFVKIKLDNKWDSTLELTEIETEPSLTSNFNEVTNNYIYSVFKEPIMNDFHKKTNYFYYNKNEKLQKIKNFYFNLIGANYKFKKYNNSNDNNNIEPLDLNIFINHNQFDQLKFIEYISNRLIDEAKKYPQY